MIASGDGGLAILGLPGIAPNTGRVPIVVGGKIFGAIGVSGVTGDQDDQIAIAGAKALQFAPVKRTSVVDFALTDFVARRLTVRDQARLIYAG